MPETLMSVCSSLLFLFMPIKSFLQLFILLLKKEYLLFISTLILFILSLIFNSFLLYLFHLCFESLDQCNLLVCDPMVVGIVTC